jgi:hypothetical protein
VGDIADLIAALELLRRLIAPEGHDLPVWSPPKRKARQTPAWLDTIKSTRFQRRLATGDNPSLATFATKRAVIAAAKRFKISVLSPGDLLKKVKL